MSRFHNNVFPNETKSYRIARDALLEEEIELRRHIESVARLKMNLPFGGIIKEDYVFDTGGDTLEDQETIRQVKFSDLFRDGKTNLIVYSFMFSSDAETPCPACTSFIDGLNGYAPHVQSRENLVIIARAPIKKIRQWALSRKWHNLLLLSSLNNSYNIDYFGETESGDQMPNLNVFSKKDGKIHHYYSSELLYVTAEENQHPRHIDLYWPVWSMFEITPEGRGQDWFPKYSYD